MFVFSAAVAPWSTQNCWAVTVNTMGRMQKTSIQD